MPGFRERVLPWTCAMCGQHNISANKSACPKCQAPRGQTPEEAAAAKQLVRVYDGHDPAKEFAADAARLAREGWRVQSQSAGGESSNVGKALLFGPLGLAAGRKVTSITV